MSYELNFHEIPGKATYQAIHLMQLAVPLWQHFEDIANESVCVDNEEPRKSLMPSSIQAKCSDTNDQLYWLVTGLQKYPDPFWKESIHEWIDFDPLNIFVEEESVMKKQTIEDAVDAALGDFTDCTNTDWSQAYDVNGATLHISYDDQMYKVEFESELIATCDSISDLAAAGSFITSSIKEELA